MKKILFFFALVLLSQGFAQTKTNDYSKLTEDEKNSITIYKKSVGSVVNVSTTQIARSFFHGEVEIPAGAGSGYVWDDQGHIVTNYHVIEKADDFVVTFHNDSKAYKAKVIGGEPKKDVAVLKLIEKPKNLIPISVGSSSDLMVGQKTIAIGNPFALDHTMTVGVVSALDRKIMGYGGVSIHGMIQTDAAINPGNSGGPLFNSLGDVIGMNTMIYSNSGSSAGLGFAVPIDTIKRIVPQIIQHGKVIRPGLGIGVLPDHMKERYFGGKGVAISYVDEKGPAGRAKLKGLAQDRYGYIHLGDIILSIDNQEVNTLDDIYQTLEKYKIGDTVTLKYRRKDKDFTIKVKLDSI